MLLNIVCRCFEIDWIYAEKNAKNARDHFDWEDRGDLPCRKNRFQARHRILFCFWWRGGAPLEVWYSEFWLNLSCRTTAKLYIYSVAKQIILQWMFLGVNKCSKMFSMSLTHVILVIHIVVIDPIINSTHAGDRCVLRHSTAILSLGQLRPGLEVWFFEGWRQKCLPQWSFCKRTWALHWLQMVAQVGF